MDVAWQPFQGENVKKLRAPHFGEREQIVVKTVKQEVIHLELDPSMFHCTTTDTEARLRALNGVSNALHDGDFITITLEPDKKWRKLRRPVMTVLEQVFEHGVEYTDPIPYG